MIRSAITGTLHFAEHLLRRSSIGFALYLTRPKNAKGMHYRR